MYKFLSTFILFFSMTTIYVAQKNTFDELNCNFHIKKLLNENLPTDWIGIFLKGEKQDVLTFCEVNNGLFRGSVKGWYYIRIQLMHLPKLLTDPKFQSIDYTPYQGQPMNDTMRVNNVINPIHNGLQPLDTSYSGSGVIVGFIDTGIDFRHQDFRTPNNRTRLLHLWDQTLSNNGFTPAAYGYGRNWDSTQINNNLANVHNDQWGHGSTVAGTAVSDGSASNSHKGVAPNSWIIAVESKFNALDWLSTVVDATEYIYTKADQHNMPCVINASLGTYLGSHDGLDPYSLYIDSLINSKNGRLFVASAGNGGQFEKYHIRNQVTPDTTFTWFKNNPSSGFGGSATFWELWADTADFNQVNYGVHANTSWPNYTISSRTGFKNVAANLNTLLYDTLYNANGNRIATVQFWAEQRDGQYLIQVFMPAPDSANYLFGFETYGTGAFDVWSRAAFGMSAIVDTIQNITNFPFLSKYVRPDSLQSIVSAFQCSEHVIAVGNYVNDSGYVNKFNNWIQTDQPRGKLALSSSLGPSRDGKIKPEVAASGHNTLSTFPLSLITTINNNPPQDTSLALGGMHRANGGTSMSSPVVAGIGALLLEKCPNMTMAEFKQLLINNTYSDGFTGTLPNVAFGYGKVDGFATLVASNFTVDYTGPLLYCTNDSTEIVLNAYETYQWSNGNADSAHFFNSPTQVAIQTTNAFGCKSDTLVLIIEEQQLPIISTPEDSLIYCDNSFSSAEITGIFESVVWSDVNTDNPRIFNTPFNGFVQAIDSVGCLSDTLFIEVIEQQRPSILNTNATINFCENDSVNITIDGIFESVNWNDLSTENPRMFYNSYTGSVIAIDSIGCKSDTLSIIIQEQLKPLIVNTENNSVFCDNESVNIEILGNFQSVSWNDLSTQNPRLFSESYIGNVVAIDSLGCISDTFEIEIIEKPLPILNCPSGNYSFCDGDSVLLSLTGIEIETVQWSDGLTENPRWFTTDFTGNAFATDTLGCQSLSCPIIVETLELPLTPIITHNFDTLFTSQTANQYIWYLNGNEIQNSTFNYYITTVNGNYTVEAIGSNGCTSVSNDYLYQSASILELGNEFYVYPNPTRDKIVIKSNLSNYTCQIFDSKGSLLQYADSKALEIEINLVSFQNGVYFLRISTTDTTFVQKIMLNK